MVEDYKKEDDEEKNEDVEVFSKKTQKVINGTIAVLKYFSLTVILFIIVSYISNKYIAGLGMNFFPMFIPVGKSFYSKPLLGSLFHKPLTDEEKAQNKFFKKVELQSGDQRAEVNYYELLGLGGYFKDIVLGLFGGGPSGNAAEIDYAQIYIVEYDKVCWWHKLVIPIFGGIQMIIAIAMTLFSCFAYLFSSKHGLFLSAPYEKKKQEEQQIFLFENKGISMVDTKSNKPVFKSGWSKFSAFINYVNFVPVDKLTYGTKYFLEDHHSSFMERFKYFFFIIFIIVLISVMRSSINKSIGGIGVIIFVIILLFIIFYKGIFKNVLDDPLANYQSLQRSLRESFGEEDITYNDIAYNIKTVKESIEEAVKDYRKNSEMIAKQLKYRIVNNSNNAAVQAEKELNPAKPQSGGNLRVKKEFQKKINELRKEIEEELKKNEQ